MSSSQEIPLLSKLSVAFMLGFLIATPMIFFMDERVHRLEAKLEACGKVATP